MNAGWHFSAEEARDARGARRQFVAFLKSMCSAKSDFDAAEAIYGELISNVIRHAPGSIQIRVGWRAGQAVLCVADTGNGFAQSLDLPESTSESGRGLYIVRELALAVEIRCTSRGCEVCAVLPVQYILKGVR